MSAILRSSLRFFAAAALIGVAACDGGGDASYTEDGYASNEPGSGPVGAWWVRTDNVEVGWTLCADGRLYGGSSIGGYSFLDKGTWSGGPDTVSISWSSQDTLLGDTWGPDSASFGYDEDSDTLCCFDGAEMTRLEGAVTNADCDPAW